MVDSNRLDAREAAIAAQVSLVAMCAAVALASAGIWGYFVAHKIIALLCIVGAVIGLIVWLVSFAISFLSKSDEEAEKLAAVFLGGYLVVGLLLIKPFLGVSDLYDSSANGNILMSIQIYWQLIDLIDLGLISFAIVVAGSVFVMLGTRLNWHLATTSLGTGILFIVVAGLLLLFAAIIAAIAVMGSLAMIAAVSRAVQGK